MNAQKKRLVVYFLFIFCGFLGAYLFLRKKNIVADDVSENVVTKKDSLFTTSLLSEFFDLENNNETFVSTKKASSGKKSCMLSTAVEYGIAISKRIGEVPSYNNLKNISVSFKCLSVMEDPFALFVFTINDDKGKSVFWTGQPFVCKNNKDWTEAKIDFIVPPQFLNPAYTIAVYPWNRNKKEFYIDDIHIDYIGTIVYKKESAKYSEKTNLFFDFETDSGLTGTDNIIETTAHSGKKAWDLSGGKEFGPTVNKKINEIGISPLKKISLSVWVYPLTDNPNTVLVASVVNSKNETVFWEGKSTEGLSFPKNKWTKINTYCSLPLEKISPNDVLGVSVWNKGKTAVIVDDLEIVYGDAPERRGNQSTIDATSIYEKRFVGEKNKPPFKIIYFEKQEIKNGADNFSPNDDFIVGDFFIDKNNLEEFVCIKKIGACLYSYSPENKQFKKIWENTGVDSLFNDSNRMFSGDFNADEKMDVLLVNKKNGAYQLIDFVEMSWVVVSKGYNTKREWMTKDEIPRVGILSNTDKIYPGKYFDNKQTFLKLNTDWRFDLKLTENIGGENVILGNVDFKGYPKDYNPKYYEFVKIVTGNFLSKNQTSMLVVMSNCADENFDGKYCKTIDNLSYLPNSVQVYLIMK